MIKAHACRAERDHSEIGFFVVNNEPFLARGHVPDNGAACRADTDGGSVGAKRHGVRSAFVLKDPLFFPRGRIPEANGIVQSARGNAATVRAEGYHRHFALCVPAGWTERRRFGWQSVAIPIRDTLRERRPGT